MISGKLDLAEVRAKLELLGGPGKESLGRRMAVAAGRVFRNEAEQQVPVGKNEWSAQAQFGGSNNAGLLKDSLYVAFNDKQSTSTTFVYSVSWNRKQAPHGHLLEFGHWRPYAIIFSPKYGWRTDKSRPLPGQGVWVRAVPFLGPAYHMGKNEAFAVALKVGREEFPKILAGQTP